MTFLLAPLFAIAGVSFNNYLDFAEYIGLFLTLLLISVTGFRSYYHERARLPPSKNVFMVRHLMAIATISIISGIAALVTTVAGVVKLFN
ncbi:MAG: hypothetical protein KC422_23130 [Trueperaceae bacterium]|nr:hypothetical protein [Trueperaceae bacterium]